MLLVLIRSSQQVLSTYICTIAGTAVSPEFTTGVWKSSGNTPKQVFLIDSISAVTM